jgi:hypothetical protein
LKLGDARYLVRDEAGEPEAVVVVRDSTVTVIDPRQEKRQPSQEEAMGALKRALEQYGELTGQPQLEDVPASNWRSGHGTGAQVAEGKGEEIRRL